MRVIDENGEMLGEMSNVDALSKARGAGLDLVEISPNERPPICKIVDFGKYQYERQKKEKARKAGSKKTEVKEVRIGFSTGEHDLEVSRKKAEKFLAKGNRVKAGLRMKGREQAHKPLAVEKLEKFVNSIENGEGEGRVEANGRIFHLMVKPKK